ncbi:unnamed protein product [Phaedon cochleariae]|uniref:Uncharacterized protein n=1 Tax=Phaedon cochleariae TaxID=80249 RepID=A0A9N9SC02_PHACE|nr:unnamed protein product [Phaedon cochleariae]
MATMINLSIAGISSVIGYSACITFFILHNYPSGVLGMISGTTDGLTCFLHYLQWKGKLREWYDSSDLMKICHIGISVATVGLLCLGYFTTIQIMLKIPMMPVSGSAVISMVWSIVAIRSGIFLMYHSIKYQGGGENLLVDNEDSGNGETA